MSSTNSRTGSRTPLPEGTIPVGIALLIAGVATYAFFKVGTVAVGGDEEFAPIATMWFATFALAPGFFLPLEQELGRALSHRRAISQGGRPVVRKVVGLGVALVAIVSLVILAASPVIASSLFSGNWFMVAAMLAAFAAYAPAHMARGICSGSGRFTEYAVVLGSDGIVRIVLCVLLALVGVTAVGAYGLAIAISPLFAVAYVYRRGALRSDPGPPAEWSEVTPNLGWLLLGSVSAAALLNAGPITASLLADPSASGLVTQFSYGVLLARIPLFLFQAVQAALLPRLSRLAARGEFGEFRSGLKQLMFVVVAVGAVGTAGAFVLGPWALRIVYDADLSGRTLAMLSLSSAVYMLALATAQAVIALQGHALVALGWAIGVVGFVLGTWLSSDEVFRRIEIGLVVSSLAALFTFALALRHRLRVGATPSHESVIEAITDMPFET
ncbi:MAG TPA: lipid II flippase MurJ [Ilumatobacteraceae bacterium]|nr:lipid II flippase MurJ [Ilumatobacteraceae bacterium]